jgi:hypothetical protein
MSDDNVIHLPLRPRVVAESPAPQPREKFGLRKPWLRAENLPDLSQASEVWELATKAAPTRKSLGALAELARAHGGNGNHVDPSLKTILAAQVDGVASQLAHLSKIAHSYGMLVEGVELNDLAGDAEMIAAHIHPLDGEQP